MSVTAAEGIIGMIARWRPVHLGHAAVLNAICRGGERVLIGIGSSNRYNLRNPFTLEETGDMLGIALEGYANYSLLPVPDLDDGPRWRGMVRDLFGPLDLFVTGNPYVASLMKETYPLAHPADLLAPDERVPIDGSMVRRAMARGEDWGALVPPGVAAYITKHGLDERFRREFGLETLALETILP
jgi:nicotinamide-nucleotide adenylyltransferase